MQASAKNSKAAGYPGKDCPRRLRRTRRLCRSRCDAGYGG
jgi:hypothetical protein